MYDYQFPCTECLLFLHKMFIGLHKMFIDFTQNVYRKKVQKSPRGGVKMKNRRPKGADLNGYWFAPAPSTSSASVTRCI